ncbi:MAG: sulfatase [Candidatus Hydrogenedentota bacterium]
MPTTRRTFLKQSAAGMMALSAAAMAGRTYAAGRKPNIVFILADDLGWADLGCYGNTYHDTPNIDRLARQGVRFTDAYAACPVCSPTRASILSGQYPAHVGVTDFISGHWRPYAKLRVPRNRTQYLPLEIDTIAEALESAGYISGHFGKWHLGGMQHFPDKQGFDDHVVSSGWGHFGNKSHPDQGWGDDDYLSEVLTDEAVRFMKENREQPFFLHLSHFGVHIPLEARQELIAKYEAKEGPEGRINNPIYAAMVEHIDHSAGRVLDTLDDLGLADDTIVVFFSDNGGLHIRYDGVGEEYVSTQKPLRGEKGTLYEGGIREPLIVRWPGHMKAGSTCAAPVTSVDFFPTFLAAAGAKAPAQPLDGLDITPLLTDGEIDRDAIYWHYPHYHHTTPAGAIRKGDWKLIEYYEDGRLELFNLARDIGEAHDLASVFPERAMALRDQLAAWRKQVNAAMPVPNPDFDPARQYEWGKYAGE